MINKIPISEIDIVFHKNFVFEYYHIWYDIQRHCISLGFISIYWCGWPWIDK